MRNSICYEHPEFENLNFHFEEPSLIKGKKVIFVVLDFETTGLDVKTSEIIQIAAKPLLARELNLGFTSLIKAKNNYVNNFNKISYDMVKEAPECREVLSKFVEWLEKLKNLYEADKIFILAHNAKFEQKFLTTNLRRHSIDLNFEIDYLDTLFVAKYGLGTKKTSITYLCEFFQISPGPDQHTAPRDIALLIQLLELIFRKSFGQQYQEKFLEWIENPSHKSTETWFSRKKILNFELISSLSSFAQKIQRKMWGIPNSAQNLNTKNMKIWQKILPPPVFATIKFDFDKKNILGSNSSLMSFHQVIISNFENLKICTYDQFMTASHPENIQSISCQETENLIMSNLPYCGYICPTCDQKHLQNFPTSN